MEVGTQHSVVAFSTLIIHSICIVLGNFNLEGNTMIYVEDQVYLVMLIYNKYIINYLIHIQLEAVEGYNLRPV